MNRSQDKKHEPLGLNARSIVLTAAGLVGMLAVVLLVCWFGMRWLVQWVPRASPPTAVDRAAPAMASWDVQPHQAYQMHDLRRQQRQRLTRYEWIERDQQAARIPIERAIELLAENDLQVDWPAAASNASEQPTQEKEDRAGEGNEQATEATAAEGKP